MTFLPPSSNQTIHQSINNRPNNDVLLLFQPTNQSVNFITHTTDMIQSLAVVNDTRPSHFYKNTLLAAIDSMVSDIPVVSISINGQNLLWNHNVIRYGEQ